MMQTKVGRFTIGSAPFAVTGVGFRPQWVVLLHSSLTTEDSWVDGASAGIGAVALANSNVNTTSLGQFCHDEIWQNDGVGYSYLNGLFTWVRDTRAGSDGWAAYISSLDADGFTVNLAGGFASNSSGRVVYYIAGEGFPFVGSTASEPVHPGWADLALGWKPEAFFGIGGGGGGTGGGNVGLIDFSVPSAVGGDWATHPTIGSMMNMFRGIFDPNINVADWWGGIPDTQSAVVLEPTTGGGAWFDDVFSATRSDTEFQGAISDGGFGGTGIARMGVFVVGGTHPTEGWIVGGAHGSFTPSDTVGGEVFVPLPFSPPGAAGLILFCPQQSGAYGLFGSIPQGATVYGIADPTGGQGVVGYGGCWNPNVDPFHSKSFMSQDYSWISNCDPGWQVGEIGDAVTAGIVEISDGGFTATTTIADQMPVRDVYYWAMGPLGGAAAAMWVPHIYRLVMPT